jgi:hypothetical protein
MMHGLLFLALVAGSLAGTHAVTDDGKDVTLDDNGTWSFTEAPVVLAEEAEPSCALVKTQMDEVTGKSNTFMTPIAVSDDNDTGFIWSLVLGETGTVIWVTQAYGASSCIDKGDKTNILFTDGSRIEMAKHTPFSCDNRSTVFFGIASARQEQLAALSTKSIKTMRVWTHDGYVERSPTTEQAVALRDSFACLNNR